MIKEYLKLLAQRESKVVLGKYYSNMWVLAIVFIATFVSIAFSNGSMVYLEEKMNDLFTNWVDIPNDAETSKFNDFKDMLEGKNTRERFYIKNVQFDLYRSLQIFKNDLSTSHYLRCRFFGDMHSDITKAILNKENIVNDCVIDTAILSNNTPGVIMTQDAIERIGYSVDSLPAYVDYMAFNEDADSKFGVDLFGSSDTAIFFPMPLPLLGVVKRLPSNLDFVASSRLYNALSEPDYLFILENHPDYLESILFSVSRDYKDTFEANVRSLNLPDSISPLKIYTCPEGMHDNILSWRDDVMYQIYLEGDDISPKANYDVCEKIKAVCDPIAVKRVYSYENSTAKSPTGAYLSVNFASLDSIRAFEKFAKDNYGVRVDMTLVNSKENFNAVSIMANILSWAMIVFSIVCIVMFIVNMLQSYFQKVKRNMGTFKAFGINSAELIMVYVGIMLVIVIVAILIALGVSWLAELLLPLFGVVKEGGYNYLHLWNSKTLWSILIIILSTVVTVCVVMSKQLKQTPGDLIYDR